jgi:vacuolar protein sorting-associated protein 13A/C
LDLNITSTFIELALGATAGFNEASANPQRIDRADEAPYKIRNRTGVDLMLWHDTDGNSRIPHDQGSKLKNNDITEWRFDDPKTMREAGQNLV